MRLRSHPDKLLQTFAHGRGLSNRHRCFQGWPHKTIPHMLSLRMITDRIEARRPPSNPRPGQGLLNHGLFAARRFLDLQLSSVLRDIRPWLEARSGSLLEIGCGDQPYRALLPAGVRYTGLDWKEGSSSFEIKPMPGVIYYDGSIFPFSDATFDSVMHTEVLEHVADVTTFLGECLRVLKPSGDMILTVPFQARFHFIPNDYWRFTPSGITNVLEKAGFTHISVKPRGTDIVVAAYKTVAVFYRLAYGGVLGKVVFFAFSWLVAILLAVAHICTRYGLGSTDDCIGYTVTARRPSKTMATGASSCGDHLAATN